jgi:Flp pilus assembly protein TadD
MAKNQDYAQQLGSAWALHRKGQNDDAIREFSSLLQLSANNMDALYGLGLAQRSSGKLDDARTSFSRCVEAIGTALKEEPREDRYQMLNRMARQRLDELKAK